MSLVLLYIAFEGQKRVEMCGKLTGEKWYFQCVLVYLCCYCKILLTGKLANTQISKVHLTEEGCFLLLMAPGGVK